MPVKDDSSIAVVWFRQDLRILDNLALLEAVSQAKLVIPLFIYDETLTEQISPAQFWWLHHSLSVLQDNLTAYGLRLILRRGKTLSIIRELKKDINFSSFHWYLNYEPEAVVIDNQLKELLDTWQVDAASISDGQVLIPPNKIKNLQGDYYKIFTPYWKESVKHMESRDYYQIPNEQFNTPKYVESYNLDSWGLISKTEQWVNKFAQYWQPGEQGAQQQVKNFIENSLSQYEVSRDFMDQDITSKLWKAFRLNERVLLDTNGKSNGETGFNWDDTLTQPMKEIQLRITLRQNYNAG
jgi:deoxyribodipyrimidine photo-lyase